MKRLTLAICSLLLAANIFAQEPAQTDGTQVKEEQKGSDTKFLLAGFAFTGFTKMDKEISNFGPTGFHPIFLWKKSDRLFFESELSVEMDDGTTKFDVEYASLHYILNKYVEISAGKFLSPFGIFNERIHPSWVNKFADNPLGFNHDVGTMVGPMAEIGIEASGGAQLGTTKINYAAYVSNGPNMITDPANSMMAGMLMYENITDNNDNKAVGGRIGFLPLSNSSLEIGASAQIAKVGDKNTEFQNIGAQLYGVDLSYVHKLSFIKSNVELKGQLTMVNVDKVTRFPVDTSMMGMDSTFDNKSQAYFVQLAIRPAYVNSKFFSNIELAGRYSSMTLPEKAMWGGDFSQVTVGINYWLSWHSVLKFDYQINNQKGADTRTGFMVQWGLGF